MASNMAPTTTGEGTSPSRCMAKTDKAIDNVRVVEGTHQRSTPLTGDVVANANNCPTNMQETKMLKLVVVKATKQMGQATIMSTTVSISDASIVSSPNTRVQMSNKSPPPSVPSKPGWPQISSVAVLGEHAAMFVNERGCVRSATETAER